MSSTSLQSISRHRSFASPSIETPDLYHGYSESSSSLSASPLTGTMAYDPVYTNLPLESTTPYTEMPYLYTPEPNYTSPPVQMIPVQLDIEGLYEEHDRRRKSSSSNGKASNSAASNRRRAQNRASQRAFRDRKEKHVKALECTLSELETKHTSLSHSYENLQQEYVAVKQELRRLSRENEFLKGAGATPGSRGSVSGSSGSGSEVSRRSNAGSVSEMGSQATSPESLERSPMWSSPGGIGGEYEGEVTAVGAWFDVGDTERLL